MDDRRRECLSRPRAAFQPGKFCELIFDDLMCWPDTRAGELVVQPCPGLGVTQNASKKCEDDGTWYISPHTNYTWTNYTMCLIKPFDQQTASVGININISELYVTWLPVIKYISQIGYWISLITLVIATMIFFSIKKLQCTRNILHMHLFASFIMRAIMAILSYIVMYEGVAFQSDIVEVKGESIYITEHYSWICKALSSAKNYFTQVNYLFILMEGIYLHNLIFLNLFSEQSSVRIYYLLAWGIPLVFIPIWVIAKMLFDNEMCWTTSSSNIWISKLIQAPIEISVLINFILFISITRILCMKINAMYLQRRIRYRRLIRSTLTLVLIFGVPYIFSITGSFFKNEKTELILIGCDQTFTSLQGLLMGLIYCFLNNEVRTEVKIKFYSLYDRHQHKRRTRTISNTVGFPLQDEY